MALKPFNSVAGFSVGEIPAVNIILANGDITASNATFSGNVLISNVNSSWGILTDNLYYANGTPWDLGGTPSGANFELQFNISNEFSSSANLTFNPSTNLLTVAGNINAANADLGNLVNANFGNFNNSVTANNISATNNVAATIFKASSSVITNNLTVNVELSGNSANFSGNVNTLNANLGNLATANFLNVSNAIVARTLTSNVATGTAPLTVSSTTKVANLNVDLLDGYNTSITVSANTIPVRDANGNLSANYFIGNGAFLTGIDAASIQNGTSNVRVLENSNVVVGIAGTANILVVSATQSNLQGNLSVNGNITANNANLGNLVKANFVQTGELFNGNSNVVITANGNVTTTASGNSVLVVSGSGANLTGYVTANGVGSFGGVESNTVTAQSGNLTLYAATGDNYIELRPTGTGQVDVGNFRIQNLADPVNAQDAATKIYVDNVAEGLHIHQAVDAATTDTLANISSGTVTYNNGVSGVGANLVTTGSYTAIDGYTLNTNDRVLVKNEANLAHNGIYVVTSSTVLTRATDYNTDAEISGGDFVFVTNGTLYNSTGWVQIDPVNVIGTDPIVWDQFSGAGTYTAGSGLTLTGTSFSVNVDNVTTEIAGGNVVVKANAQLTTPNIGAATGTSLSVTGNIVGNTVTANSLVSTANLTATGNIIANNVTVNLSLSGNTANFTGNITALNANLGNLARANFFTGTLINGTSNVVVNNNGNINLTAGSNTTLVVTSTGANITGYANVTGNLSAANIEANIANVTNVKVGNTQVGWGTVTTTSISANQTIATLAVTGVTGVEFLVKGVDATGSKYTVATVQAVTNGSSVDYATYGTVNLGGLVGTFAVNIVGSNVALQVSPASANSTVWTTQFRTI